LGKFKGIKTQRFAPAGDDELIDDNDTKSAMSGEPRDKSLNQFKG